MEAEEAVEQPEGRVASSGRRPGLEVGEVVEAQGDGEGLEEAEVEGLEVGAVVDIKGSSAAFVPCFVFQLYLNRTIVVKCEGFMNIK